MTSHPRLTVVSPASTDRWTTHFLADATATDDTGFPLRGSFGIHFSCPTDLSTATDDHLRATIASTSPTKSPQQIAIAVNQLRIAYTTLQPDTLLAFKQGQTIVAFVRIVSPYTYDPRRERYPHRWNYITIRRATPAEAHPPNARGLLQTIHRDYIPTPTDLLPPIRHLSEELLAEFREAHSRPY